jgi:predicted amidohydrolase
MIIGPDGEVILELGDEQGVFYLNFDTKVISDQRELFPVLKDIK